MWRVNGNDLEMVEGDYGIGLPVTVSGTTLTQQDSLRFTFKKAVYGTTVLEKDYTEITANTAQLALTKAESELFPAGTYAYSLDWYQSGTFMCNIIPTALFKVVGKV